jgi:hypothetical protein
MPTNTAQWLGVLLTTAGRHAGGWGGSCCWGGWAIGGRPGPPAIAAASAAAAAAAAAMLGMLGLPGGGGPMPGCAGGPCPAVEN